MNYYLIANFLLSIIVGALIIFVLKHGTFKSYYNMIHRIHAGIIFTCLVCLIVTVGTFCIVVNSAIFMIKTIVFIIFVMSYLIIVFVDMLIIIFKAINHCLNRIK